MAQFLGMNVEEVRRLARELNSEADRIGGLITEITKTVDEMQVHWKGQDAARFKGWWESEHRPRMSQAQEAIAGLSRSAINNAEEQQTASS